MTEIKGDHHERMVTIPKRAQRVSGKSDFTDYFGAEDCFEWIKVSKLIKP